MSTALIVVTDGRDHIYKTIPSALANIEGDLDQRIIYDDSADPANGDRLRTAFEPLGFTILGTPIREGFGGAIRSLWHLVPDLGVDWVFHCEDDFVFNRPVHLARMAAVLDMNAELAQMVLRRQPWNEQERAAGGIVEQHPDDYLDRSDVFGNQWLEHRRFFSTNPSLFRASLCARGWPDVPHSEGVFTHELLADGYRFAFWGPRTDAPWVQHTGTERVGLGY